jgi:hypothetical protein
MEAFGIGDVKSLGGKQRSASKTLGQFFDLSLSIPIDNKESGSDAPITPLLPGHAFFGHSLSAARKVEPLTDLRSWVP